MQLNLWLAQPETERKLAACVRIASIALACWAVALAYGLWSTRSALAASQTIVASQNKKITEAAQALPRRRDEAANAARVKVAASKSAASADITDELSRVAQVAGAKIAGVRIGDGTPGQRAAQSVASSAKPATAASASTPASADEKWDQESFECNAAGDYGALTRFLNLLAASRRVMEITTVDMTQVGGKTKGSGPKLEMKMNGIVYELPENP